MIYINRNIYDTTSVLNTFELHSVGVYNLYLK